jgi:hypothetical protein
MPEEIIPLTISISRKNLFTGKSSWAVFQDHFKCVKDFVDYTDEAAALAEAKEWVKNCGLPGADLEPKIVYPKITKARFS